MHTVFLKLRQAIFDLRMELWLARSFRRILGGRPLPKPPRFIVIVLIGLALGLAACDINITNGNGPQRDSGPTRVLDSTRTSGRG